MPRLPPAKRSRSKRQAVARALARLLKLAEERDSGQSPRIARFLVKTYDGEAFKLARNGGDLKLPTQAIAALRSGIPTPKTSPFTCRKAGQSPFLRELNVPFGRLGCDRCSMFEFEDQANVAVLAVHHQLKGDDH